MKTVRRDERKLVDTDLRLKIEEIWRMQVSEKQWCFYELLYIAGSVEMLR